MKKTMIRNTLILLVTMVFSSIGMGQSVSFKIPFSIKNNFGNEKKAYFGVNPEATYCADSSICNFYDDGCVEEQRLPPVNTLCDTCFEWRFIEPRVNTDIDCMDLGMNHNIHGFTDTTQVDTFLVAICHTQTSNTLWPMTFRWPKTLRYYADSIRLKDNFGFAFDLFSVNMATVDSFKLSNNGIRQVRILMYGPKPLPPLIGPPSLSLPADNATGQSQTVTLSWSSVAGAGKYRLQVSTDSLFGSFVFDDTVNVTSKQITGLSELTKYYWHVSALNIIEVGRYQTVPFRFSTSGNPPALVTPTANQVNVPTSTTLVWNKGPYTAQYQVQLSDDQNFATTIVDQSGLTDTTKALTGLANCNVYYWRVRAGNSAGTTPYSSVRSFTVAEATPAVPVLIAPAADLTNVSLSPVLSWTGDACSQSYTLEVRLADSIGTVVFSGAVGGTSQALSNLDQLANYYWRVKASNGGGSSSVFTSFRKFTTVLNPPNVPTLISPANGSTASTNPTFIWNSDPNVNTYHLQVSLTSNFSQFDINDSTLVGPTWTDTTGLTNCVTYYWRVKATNANGPSAFSAANNFIVEESVPLVPTLLGPLNAQVNVGFDTTLTWQDTGFCSQSFHYQVSLFSDFSILAIDDTSFTQSAAIGPLVGDTIYYWRVKSMNATGESNYSSSFSFRTTGFTPPPTPALLSPGSGDGDVLMNPTLTWNATPRATTYRLQVAFDSAFTILFINDSTITTPSKSIGPLLNSTCYYWRVNAKNSKGTSSFSDKRKFCTLYPPTSPTLVIPANGATNISVITPFVWGLADRADVYQLQVSRLPAFDNLVFNDSTLANNQATLPGALKGNREFCWQVRAKNAAGWGAWSAPSCFTTEYTMPADWTIPLAVAETGPARDTLRFGVKLGATKGIDPGLGEFELPPPTFGIFDIRFTGPSIGEGLLMNIAPFYNISQIDTFVFEFQPGIGSYPIQLSWPQSFIQTICESMVLMDNAGGLTVNVRMDQTSSLSVTNESISSLKIIKVGARPIDDVKPVAVAEVPKGFSLQQNYPNPFNPSTQIQFSTDQMAYVRIAVYDVLGREISELASGTYSAGFYQMTWDGKDFRGTQMPSGVYYVRMLGKGIFDAENAGKHFTSSRKMLMLK